MTCTTIESETGDDAIVPSPDPSMADGAGPTSPPKAANTAGEESLVDQREALYNGGCTGPAGRIQIPAERITRLNGIMVDFDPGNLDPNNRILPPADDPHQFLDRSRAVLDRHPVLRFAEVRSSGTGLHLVTRLNPPVELRTAGEQRYWDAIVRAVQASLPSDPNAPGITALTRPVGSINSKNGARVETLRPGSPIDPQRAVVFVKQLEAAPFRVIAEILFGGDHLTPCPLCVRKDSRLSAMERMGKCYHCGAVRLEALYAAIFSREAEAETEEHAAGRQGKNPSTSSTKQRRKTARRR
jgi:hypothetical protein